MLGGLDVGLMIRSVPYLAEGALVTILLTVVSVSLGMIGGTILGMARLSSNRIENNLKIA